MSHEYWIAYSLSGEEFSIYAKDLTGSPGAAKVMLFFLESPISNPVDQMRVFRTLLDGIGLEYFATAG